MEKLYKELNQNLLDIPNKYLLSFENFSKDIAFRMLKELSELRNNNINIDVKYQEIAAINYRNALIRYRDAFEKKLKELDIKDKNINIDDKFIELEKYNELLVSFLENMKNHSSFGDVASRIEVDVYNELLKNNSKKNILLEESFAIKKTIRNHSKKVESYHLDHTISLVLDEVDSIFKMAEDYLRNENDMEMSKGQERAPVLVYAMNQFKNVDIREEPTIPERLDPNIFKV